MKVLFEYTVHIKLRSYALLPSLIILLILLVLLLYWLGDNILIPQPAFPLYRVVANSLGGHVKSYALKVRYEISDMHSVSMVFQLLLFCALHFRIF